MRPEFRGDAVGILGMETQSQGIGIIIAAHQTVAVPPCGTDIN
jgi:hypothetical protein